MTSTQSNRFSDSFLKFSLEKPSQWHFLPAAWSPIAMMHKSEDPGLEWAKNVNLPFCCARGNHDSEFHPYPTLQVTARPFQVPGNEGAAAILEQNLAFFAQCQLDFELVEASSHAIIAGHRANKIISRYTLLTEQDGEEREFPVLARSTLIFAPGRAFSVGMSSSADAAYFNDADFSSTLASIRIGI